MAIATFSFELDTRYMRHMKEESHYNHNYYELILDYYGDYIIPRQCNVLYEECDEFSDTYTYSLGYFDTGKFYEMFTWTEMECKTSEVKL